MTDPIAIVGMACRFPDAASPDELWQNVLARRRSFRPMPAERLRLADYMAGRETADSLHDLEVGLLTDYRFDRAAFRVSREAFESTDLAHWLALETADRALADAGFAGGEGLPRRTTGVIVGNTLTGEFSRAASLRLRWPYVRRVVASVLADEGLVPEKRQALLARLEQAYKAPFPPAGDETLAGSLSNTIAGRICNYFDLGGGGYTVDGACSSSLLAVADACAALAGGEIDVAVVGGVDLSLDPFELVGFARIGALARREMRVYDAESRGFWPGEGCGFLVLMRAGDAARQARRAYAFIRGWGVSSDGSGGLTRPEAEGQLLALRRAYQRAGVPAGSVAYLEGHGTGTAVGDAVELRALTRAVREDPDDGPAPAVGSVKALIGHTKAAAGVAGLIKAAMAVHRQVLPPSAGAQIPHPEVAGRAAALRLLDEAELWPDGKPLRAGVSSMGFGGINVHVVLDGAAPARRRLLEPAEAALSASWQDAELVLLAGDTVQALVNEIDRLLEACAWLSRAELTDLAQAAAVEPPVGALRAALVAAAPSDLTAQLRTLRGWLEQGATSRLDPQEGIFLARAGDPSRIGFLFPGQASPLYTGSGALARRFPFVRELYDAAPFRAESGASPSAQTAIVTASLAGLRALDRLGIAAAVGCGHSLGELTALAWAGALDEEGLIRLATVRGEAMVRGAASGVMASLRTGPAEAAGLLAGTDVTVACRNGPSQTVVSGTEAELSLVLSRAAQRGISAVRLPVPFAFHSALMEGALPELRQQLEATRFGALQRPVISTVTGRPLERDTDLAALLLRQVTAPVLFTDALARVAEQASLLIEVGPGSILGGLAAEAGSAPAVSMDAGGPSLRGVLQAAGAAWALGHPVDLGTLAAGRFARPTRAGRRPLFLVNPCEMAPLPNGEQVPAPVSPADEAAAAGAAYRAGADGTPAAPTAADASSISHVLPMLRQLVAERTELPVGAIADDSRLLDDLHLNSITVGQLAIEAARRLGLPPPVAPAEYAGATLGSMAQALCELAATGAGSALHESEPFPAGVRAWVRPFTVALEERPRPSGRTLRPDARWTVLAPAGHPVAALQAALSAPGSSGGPPDGREEGPVTGVALCLPPLAGPESVAHMIGAARAVIESEECTHFLLVQHGGGGGGFARTLHLETGVITCVVDVPPDHPQAPGWIAAEAAAAAGYTEAHYDRSGTRRVPILRPLQTDRDGAGEMALRADDLLLVTGGGKGIAAECALALARRTGVRLALLGRSVPERDPELAANLERMTAHGVTFRYLSCDVTDPAAVRTSLRELVSSMGSVTALLHGAGVNRPRLLRDQDADGFRQTLEPKVTGLAHLLAEIDPDRLRLLVGFGSVIARTGMRGEADYAVANEWMTRLIEDWAAEYPACRCLSLEWSVWSGVGMGERLGRVDALGHAGITPISADEGVEIFCRLIGALSGLRRLPTAVLVTGRLGTVPTLSLPEQELPLLRFLEEPRLFYPGLELVADAALSPATDPYLDDHRLRGDRLLPGVIGLEAMAQAATAVAGLDRTPRFEQVAFLRPVVVPPHGGLTLRVAALVTEPGTVETVIRSSETEFQADHVRALCRFAAEAAPQRDPAGTIESDAAVLPIEPDRDLYDSILFQSGRFRRVRGYRQLNATACAAEVQADGGVSWFAQFLPGALLLGDPGARDAAVHAVQAAIPHLTVLPAEVERIAVYRVPRSGMLLVDARERWSGGGTFVWDLAVSDLSGEILERWEGLRLRQTGPLRSAGPWPDPLLSACLERRVRELIPGCDLSILLTRTEGEQPAFGSARRALSRTAMRKAAGSPVPVLTRPDGRPETAEARGVSAAHSGGLVLAVAGLGPLGCDLEAVRSRTPEDWSGLLGRERFNLAQLVARQAMEDEQTAATRVWSALESARKAGVSAGGSLLLHSTHAGGWVVLSAGDWLVATGVVAVQDGPPLVCAVLGRGGREGV